MRQKQKMCELELNEQKKIITLNGYISNHDKILS